jgi:hypothetical protein
MGRAVSVRHDRGRLEVPRQGVSARRLLKAEPPAVPLTRKFAVFELFAPLEAVN